MKDKTNLKSLGRLEDIVLYTSLFYFSGQSYLLQVLKLVNFAKLDHDMTRR